jgi:hypothetical protein
LKSLQNQEANQGDLWVYKGLENHTKLFTLWATFRVFIDPFSGHFSGTEKVQPRETKDVILAKFRNLLRK